MPKIPDSVLTKNRKGETEIRNFLSEGRFVKYNYTDPDTGKVKDKGKFSVILRTENKEDEEEHYFFIPMKGNRFLVILEKAKKERYVWDGKKAVKV